MWLSVKLPQIDVRSAVIKLNFPLTSQTDFYPSLFLPRMVTLSRSISKKHVHFLMAFKQVLWRNTHSIFPKPHTEEATHVHGVIKALFRLYLFFFF